MKRLRFLYYCPKCDKTSDYTCCSCNGILDSNKILMDSEGDVYCKPMEYNEQIVTDMIEFDRETSFEGNKLIRQGSIHAGLLDASLQKQAQREGYKDWHERSVAYLEKWRKEYERREREGYNHIMFERIHH